MPQKTAASFFIRFLRFLWPVMLAVSSCVLQVNHGRVFSTDTDTEVIPILCSYLYDTKQPADFKEVSSRSNHASGASCSVIPTVNCTCHICTKYCRPRAFCPASQQLDRVSFFAGITAGTLMHANIFWSFLLLTILNTFVSFTTSHNLLEVVQFLKVVQACSSHLLLYDRFMQANA